MAFSDIFKGLDDLIVRKKAAQPALEQLQEINDMLTEWTMTGQPKQFTSKIMGAQETGKDGEKKKPLLPGSDMFESLKLTQPPPTKGPVDIPGTISKGTGLALTPLNIASDIAQQAITPALNVLKPIQEFKYGPKMQLAEKAMQADFWKEIYKAQAAQSLAGQKAGYASELQEQKDVSAMDRERYKQGEQSKRLDRKIAAKEKEVNKRIGTKNLSMAQLLARASAEKRAGDSTLWDDIIQWGMKNPLAMLLSGMMSSAGGIVPPASEDNTLTYNPETGELE